MMNAECGIGNRLSLRGMPACGRQEMMKPCPEQSEGTFEIATGYALATTLGRIATLSR
jgi:hypothetical protein